MAIDTQFAELVLPASGYYITAIQTRNFNNDQIVIHRYQSDFEGFIRENYAADQKPNDTIYFCTASVEHNDDGTKQRNLAAKQCLHIDIDVGFPDFVQTQADAVREVYRLCEITNIPPPSALVSSGYGVHVYWAFTHAFTQRDILVWQRLANGLRNAALEHAKLLTKDLSKWTTRTALLRLPGTENKKRSTTAKVEVIGGTFERYPVFYFDNLNSFETDLAAPRVSQKREIETISGEALKAQCAVINELAQRDGDMHYLAWRDLIHYSHHVTEGVAWAHELSQGPHYNPAALDRIYDYYVERHEQHEYMPPRCSTFCADAGFKQDDICRRCPLFMAGKSPLALPTAKALEVVAFKDVSALQQFAASSDTLPPFIIDPYNGRHYMINAHGELLEQPVEPKEDDTGGVMFSNAWWVEGKHDEHNTTYYTIVVVEEIEAGRDSDKHAYLPKTTRVTRMKGEAFADPKALAKGLGNAGVRVVGNKMRCFEYAHVAANHSGNTADCVRAFGWQPDGRFVLGRGAFRSDGTIVSVAMSGHLKARDVDSKIATGAISQSASELGVLSAMKAFSDNASPLGKALFLAAISAPLYELAALDGFTLLLYGESGKGKTSLNRLLSCIYGKPDSGMIRGTDTPASWDATRGLYRSLPIMFDEFTIAGKGSKPVPSEEDKDTFILTTSDGRSKKVGTPDQQQRGGNDTWHTLVIGGTNTNYVESANIRLNDFRADAQLSRMSQVRLDGSVVPKEKWPEVEQLFVENHGLIGAKFMSYVVPRRDEITMRIASAVAAANHNPNVATEARFKIKVLSCAFVAQEILKASGLADFGLKEREIMELLELHRFNPSVGTVGAWNRVNESVNVDAVLGSLTVGMQPRLQAFREDATGALLPLATASPIMGGVAGFIVREASGDVVYTISTAEIMRAKFAIEFTHTLPEVLRKLESVRCPLTEDGMAVSCVRIRLRNGVPLLPQNSDSVSTKPTQKGLTK